MATAISWVHGNSGQLEVVGSHWGGTTVHGWGLSLEGRVQHPDNHDEPWVHFHIPMPSIAIEDRRQLPKLRKVMLLFATDCNAGKRSDWILEADNYYKYETDNGGAIVTQIDLWDGAMFFFSKDLQWQSTNINTPQEEVLTLPHDFVIQYGLGLSLRVRFKNQMRVKKLKCDDISNYLSSSASPVANYEAEEEPTTRTHTKSAIIHSIGCEFVPAGP